MKFNLRPQPKLKKSLQKYWLVLVLILFLFLRLPSLFEPFTYGDEGIYLTLGQAARKGLVWYKDIHDNKPPMLYLMAAIANNFQAYRLIFFGWSLITLLAFWQLAKLIFLKNNLAIGLSTAAFALLTNLHNFEGNVANAENFMFLPTIAGFFLIYEYFGPEQFLREKLIRKNFRKTGPLLFLAGFLFGVATLFKVPAGFDFIAALIFGFLVFYESKKRPYLKFIAYIVLTLLGFLTPIVLSFAYYALKGALIPYFKAAFAQNLPYLSSWAGSAPQASGLPLALLARGFLILVLLLGLLFLKARLSRAAKLTLVWFAFSWFAALLSSRPYPHYLLQILPSICLSFGFLALLSKKTWPRVFIPLALFVLFRVTFWIFHFWDYPNQPYYLNFYQYALGVKSQPEYFDDFDSQAKFIYQTADHLRKRNFVKDKIFVWGTQPSIYAIANRLPTGRFTTSYHIIDFNGKNETIQALKLEPPRYILITGDEKRPFPELTALIQTDYVFDKKIGPIVIFYRLP